MELLNSINFEQLGTAGIFIAYLIWQLSRKEKQLEDKDQERKEWQERAFNVTRETQKELFESTKVFEKAINALRG